MSATTRNALPLGAGDPRWSTAAGDVHGVALDHRGRLRWWVAMLIALGLVGLLAGSVFWVLIEGVGVWGNNTPVVWALDIVGYDWWIGVASGALLISAILLLLGVGWRGAVNRMAETTAVLAAVAAGLYPIIHLGRPWFFFWTLPYPNTLALWPQFRSPLYWDAVDIISFLGTAICFWYVGMLPDLAAMRDRAIERTERGAGQPGSWARLLRAQLYGIAAIGWRGAAAHWQRWEQACQAIAAMGVVLVVSLQTGAAVMFGGTVEPGWHDALSPVAFLFAALFSGVAMVALQLVVIRHVLQLERMLTPRHLDMLALLLLGLGFANIYCYGAAIASTALRGDAFEQVAMLRRLFGSHGWSGWAVILGSLLPVQLFWLRALRRSPIVLGAVGLLVGLGMWAGHFMVIVVTLQHDFLPSSDHPYAVGIVGLTTFLGTVGLFLFLMLLFLRALPAISVAETRRLGGPNGVARG